uniref:NADH dehydrogenase subunit 3 n=1 Tax=Glaucosphaera vacuolata TaxID=38265 RepID=UPI001FCD1697|nr:NADH dehydrogenase subunit 3 [Glaucosphaera vacuolata]UNJ18770.1 NADH dehydrogenase subunit 3 [Glaucosphaera vacuolata]
MYSEYGSILVYFFICVFLSFLILGLSYFLVPQNYNHEKTSAYECGFNPFEDARTTFDVRFYLVAILFLIFDLEISFLFPWSLVLNKISKLGFWYMLIFLFTLTVGFIYEWFKGALEWE